MTDEGKRRRRKKNKQGLRRRRRLFSSSLNRFEKSTNVATGYSMASRIVPLDSNFKRRLFEDRYLCGGREALTIRWSASARETSVVVWRTQSGSFSAFSCWRRSEVNLASAYLNQPRKPSPLNTRTSLSGRRGVCLFNLPNSRR